MSHKKEVIAIYVDSSNIISDLSKNAMSSLKFDNDYKYYKSEPQLLFIKISRKLIFDKYFSASICI